jgi:hypothetical protein
MTATMVIEPMTYCQYDSIPAKSSRLPIRPRTAAAARVPAMLPRPPVKRAPVSATAAIALRR